MNTNLFIMKNLLFIIKQNNFVLKFIHHSIKFIFCAHLGIGIELLGINEENFCIDINYKFSSITSFTEIVKM